jgi:hypothetical protein
MAHCSHLLLSALLVAAATTAGHAAELGEAQVLSHIGQALVADVELTLVEDPAAKVAVRLANPDVYRGANIAMPPVLSSLNMTVMRRDGRQFLHLTSLKPVESRILHVYLELVDGGQRSVRLVSLWLTPDPNPAPAPPPLPLPVREPAAEPVKVAPVAAVPMPKPVPAPRPAAALQAGEEYVDVAKPVPPVARKLLVKAVPKPAPVRKPVPVPVVAAPAEAPTCAPQAANEHLNACVALGEKNAALHQQLGKLEEKVKVLQGAAPIAVPAAMPVPVPAPAAQEAPKPVPKGAPRIHRKPKKVEPPEAETPWLLIGGAIGAVLAIGTLVLALLRRRKRSSFGKIPAEHKPAKIPKAGEGEPKPHFMAAVKARLMPGRAKEAAPAAEPVAEQAE